MVEPPETFAGLLRRLRTGAGLTQEELAEASGVSLRSVSDLERGRVAMPHRDTVRLLAGALRLIGPLRVQFEAAAGGRVAAAGAAGAVATRTLPRDVASFTGRQQELAELIDAVARAGGVVGIHAIGGMAGVGKTAFAVHAAHRLADRFPAGQIFLPLHGHTPGQLPVDPEDALASLLLTIGVPPGQVPAGLEARTALWRDRLASRQLLLILDDAVGSEQVHPLLPGAGGNLVLVTSRRRLTALQDAASISLDALPAQDAAALLIRLTGRAGLSVADPAVGEIIGLCGFLPLAIGMVARHLQHHPAWSLVRRAAELAAERDRLELMATENVSVAAAFDLSYADLDPDQQRLFRRLGLHPGSEFDVYATAALDVTDLAAARRGLEALHDRYLLTEPGRGRYRMHDLIREHARALAGRLGPDDDRDLATGRLLDYYQRTAIRADALIARQVSAFPESPAGAPPAAVPVLDDREHALAWARAERANVIACLDHATADGQHARIVALTAGLAGLLDQDGPWAEARIRHAAALKSTRQLGDRPGQANALTNLGNTYRLTGDYPAAVLAFDEALAIYHDLDDRLGQASALHGVGLNALRTGDFLTASHAHEQELDLYRDLGDRLGQANALCQLGNLRRFAGDVAGATSALEEALADFRDLDDRLGQANALSYLGDARIAADDYPAARLAQEEALSIYRDLDHRLGQANALSGLAFVQRVTGHIPAAAKHLKEALGIFLDLGDRLGEARVLNDLGIVWRQAGDYPAAIGNAEQALGICRDIGSRLGQANVSVSLGIARRLSGDHPGAAGDLAEAIAIFRDIGARANEGDALNELGALHRIDGDITQARACHQEALDLARQMDSVWGEAHGLAGLGRCALAAGRVDEAEDQLRQALEIFQRIGAFEAAEVAAELDALPGPAGSGR